MYDDVSAISNYGCNVLTGSNTLSNYNGNTRHDYIQNGGRWYLYRTQTSNIGNFDISSYNCIDISTLKSYAIYEPFVYGFGFVLFLLTLWVFFKTIKGFMHAI